MAKTKKFNAKQHELFPAIVRTENIQKLTRAVIRSLDNERWRGDLDVQIEVLTSLADQVEKLQASRAFAAEQLAAATGSANGVAPQ